MGPEQGGETDALHKGPFAVRRAGLLLHPTSLPGGPGNGDLGPEAFHFVEFMAAAGVSVWQMLPLGPTHEDGSPYQCTSVHAGNYRLISLQRLVDRGWLAPAALESGEAPDHLRQRCLRLAYAGFQQHDGGEEQARLERFTAAHASWLEDFALYQALKDEQHGRSWADWPPQLRDRQPAALAEARGRLAVQIAQVGFEQFVFFSQWQALRDYARERGILLFGDMPIFVAHDSADVWANRDYFVLDDRGQMDVVAGVPPDYFSATGQRWGNPHYRWQALEQADYRWWVERVRTQIELFDFIRVDHFRGFEAYWEIPARAETAVDGRWIKAPGRALFNRLLQAFGRLPLVAEDLGIITPEVEGLRDAFGLPGMKILQFAFGGDASNPYLPHNHRPLCVVYTGTHDNNTTLGWYQELGRPERHRLREYYGYPREKMPWPVIRMAFASVARMAIVPLQDVLELDAAHRMNRPGVSDGNWRWRYDWSQVPEELAGRLRTLVGMYGRLVVSG
jgi:4-alpha-glucanotransferase